MKIYLTCPHHPDINIETTFFTTITKKAIELIEAGHTVYSPITLSRPHERNRLPGEEEFWEEIDRKFIGWADVVLVMCFSGWEENVPEIKLAEELGKTIKYIKRKETKEAKDDN